jgi:uridine kinase
LQVDPADVIIVEGILVLHMEELRAHCNMLVYVDTGAASGDVWFLLIKCGFTSAWSGAQQHAQKTRCV